MATAKTGTISSPGRKIRARPTPRAQIARIAPARCTATKTTSSAGRAPKKVGLKTFAPKSSRKPRTGADEHQRDDAGEQDDRVAHHRRGEQQAHQHRYIPLRPGAVDQQPDDQQG